MFENCCEDENCSINSAYCSSGLLISKAARVKVVLDWFKWKSRHSVADAGVRQNMFNQQQPERKRYREMIHKALQYHKVAHKINLITAFWDSLATVPTTLLGSGSSEKHINETEEYLGRIKCQVVWWDTQTSFGVYQERDSNMHRICSE